MGIIIIAAAAVIIIYFLLIAPRMIGKPDMSPLFGAHYAHRGLHDNETEAPENSLPAFQKAVEAGYGIELDVQMTADGQVVVTHDFHLRRICGEDKQVNELTYDQLKKYDILKSKEHIPLFSEVLRLVDGRVPLIVELKCRGKNDPIAAETDKLLKGYKGVYCIESFDPRALMWYRKNRPDVVRGQLSGYLNQEVEQAGPGMRIMYYLLTHLLLNVAVRPDFIAYDIRHQKEISKNICRRMGCPSVAWTVRTEADYMNCRSRYDLFIFEGFRL